MFHSLLLVAALMPPTPTRVGQIFIAGNEVTPSDVIVSRLSLFPGQAFSAAGVRAAKWNLAWLQLLGIGSTVELLGEADTKDILVKVHETPITWFLVGLPEEILTRLERSRR
jgi:outer membrane protein assembly factor BamA